MNPVIILLAQLQKGPCTVRTKTSTISFDENYYEMHETCWDTDIAKAKVMNKHRLLLLRLASTL